jgi:predicted 3-demethylubiquinone-9 3-methyltransferase (glyoxalase superfamily)
VHCDKSARQVAAMGQKRRFQRLLGMSAFPPNVLQNSANGCPTDRNGQQPTRISVMTSITPFLWFDNNVPEAVAFYKSVFPNAKVETVNDFMATFELEGQKFNALNGGPKYKFNEAISFFISVETQEEVDYFWNRLIADGGEESKCGWLKDKFGLSWQVVPTALGRYLSDPDRKKADRAMQAMMKMQKIVIADLDKAFAG